jgi:hypothetical protein
MANETQAVCEVCGEPLATFEESDGVVRYDAAIAGGTLACRGCLGAEAAAELLPERTCPDGGHCDHPDGPGDCPGRKDLVGSCAYWR